MVVLLYRYVWSSGVLYGLDGSCLVHNGHIWSSMVFYGPVWFYNFKLKTLLYLIGHQHVYKIRRN